MLKEWSAREVAKALEVSLPAVYLAKHRVRALLKKEVKRLEAAEDKADQADGNAAKPRIRP